jgi:hypothetical protein
MLAALSLVLQLSLFSPPPVDARFPSPLDLMREEVGAAVKRFEQLWRQSWERSLVERSRTAPMSGRQIRLQHCHAQLGIANQPNNPYLLDEALLVRSVQQGHFRCPSWISGMLGTRVDESLDFDAMLTPEHRERARANRASLMDAIDRVRTRFPEDAALFALQLRLVMDHGSRRRAEGMIANCQVDPAMCALADGYVADAAGDLVRAEAAFSDPRIPAEWFCGDRDLVMAFGREEVARWDRMDCRARRGWMDTLWWLADPFWIESGNPRRTAHLARRVHLELRGLDRRDERFVWDEFAGGDALRKAVLWYGWPTVFGAGGGSGRYALASTTTLDQGHTAYLVREGYNGANPEPYTTIEYSRGRVALLPPPTVRRDPFQTAEGAWTIAPPRLRDGRADTTWWPQEFWRPPQPMADLDPGQTVLLRRDSAVLIASATNVPPSSSSEPPLSLIASRGPGDVQRIAAAAPREDAPVILQGAMSSAPTMLSLELPRRPPAIAPALRARWSVDPPPTLETFREGELAVSMPAIYVLPEDDRDIVPVPDSIIPRLYGSLRFETPGRVGIYWETYGAKPGDTLDVAIWLERVTGQGVVRSLGIVLRVAEDLNTPIAISWREPRLGTLSSVLPTRVSTVARSVALNLGDLTPGAYRLEVAVARPGEPAVRGRTRIEVGQ